MRIIFSKICAILRLCASQYAKFELNLCAKRLLYPLNCTHALTCEFGYITDGVALMKEADDILILFPRSSQPNSMKKLFRIITVH